jgi:signal peptidase II
LSGRGGVLIKAALVCAAVVAVDQLSKGIVRDQIARGDSIEVLPFLDFENTRNRGIAFGLAGDVAPALIGAAIAALLGLLGFLSLRREADPLIWLPAGLLVGGALGNLADRVRDGAVTDFIDFPAWPTFNLADVSIVVGVMLLVLLPEIRGRLEQRDDVR